MMYLTCVFSDLENRRYSKTIVKINHSTTITTTLLCKNIHIQESRKVIKVYKIIHVHVCTFYFTLMHASTDTNDVFWNNS